jgi:glycosyltransferase involved in cell wall biosynthesis
VKKNKDNSIFFAFTKPANFSGQTAASELIINSLSSIGIKCIPILLYPLTRNNKNSFVSYFQLFLKQAGITPKLISLLFYPKPILHLNLGQSYWSFIRIGFWYFPIRFFNRGIRVVTSLHGSTFMKWECRSMIKKLLMSFLASSQIITVLGERQKAKLVQFGLSPDRIRIVPNSCNMNIVTESFIEEKHHNQKLTINILHLSLLIESKGFPLFLEALELLANRKLAQKIRAILCGPITLTPFSNKFKSADDQKAWIESKIEFINRLSNGQVNVKWIPGASGYLKQKLFEDSHIFVFPSSFPVEAQPIVLLEALATGSCIITSDVGEIATTLNHDCAIFIEQPGSLRLADEIYELIIKPEIRTKMAINGIALIKGPLSLDFHISTWKTIFSELRN